MSCSKEDATTKKSMEKILNGERKSKKKKKKKQRKTDENSLILLLLLQIMKALRKRVDSLDDEDDDTPRKRKRRKILHLLDERQTALDSRVLSDVHSHTYSQFGVSTKDITTTNNTKTKGTSCSISHAVLSTRHEQLFTSLSWW